MSELEPWSERSGWEPGPLEAEAILGEETAPVDVNALFDKATEAPETLSSEELAHLQLIDPAMFGVGEAL